MDSVNSESWTEDPVRFVAVLPNTEAMSTVERAATWRKEDERMKGRRKRERGEKASCAGQDEESGEGKREGGEMKKKRVMLLTQQQRTKRKAPFGSASSEAVGDYRLVQAIDSPDSRLLLGEFKLSFKEDFEDGEGRGKENKVQQLVCLPRSLAERVRKGQALEEREHPSMQLAKICSTARSTDSRQVE